MKNRSEILKMQGFLEVDPKSLTHLATQCITYIHEFDKTPYKAKEITIHPLKMKITERIVYSGLPAWYQEKYALLRHFEKLIEKAELSESTGDKLFISEPFYRNVLMLVNGNINANPYDIIG